MDEPSRRDVGRAHPAATTDLPLAQSTADAPRVVVPERVFSFNGVVEGEIVTHAYTVENQGDRPLHFLDVRTSCGCTTARPPAPIDPGSSGQIVVSGDTDGYGGATFHMTVTVLTDDPIEPQIELELKGPVVKFATIEPARITLAGKCGEPVVIQAVITPNPDHPFRIADAIPDDRLADVIDVHLDRQPDGVYRIAVHNRLTTPGQYRGRIVLRTDSRLRPQLYLYVIGRIDA